MRGHLRLRRHRGWLSADSLAEFGSDIAFVWRCTRIGMWRDPWVIGVCWRFWTRWLRRKRTAMQIIESSAIKSKVVTKVKYSSDLEEAVRKAFVPLAYRRVCKEGPMLEELKGTRNPHFPDYDSDLPMPWSPDTGKIDGFGTGEKRDGDVVPGVYRR